MYWISLVTIPIKGTTFSDTCICIFGKDLLVPISNCIYAENGGLWFYKLTILSSLLQDVESYDPILNPVLNRELRRTGGRVLITIGDQDIDLSPSFTIFLSTRDPTVRYSVYWYVNKRSLDPVSAKINILCFNKKNIIYKGTVSKINLEVGFMTQNLFMAYGPI